MGLFNPNITFSNCFFLFLVLASAIPTCLGTSQVCIHQHFSALLRLKLAFQFGPSSSGNLSSWNADNRNCCTWEGITCNSSTGHVITLDLSGHEISGQMDFQTLSQLGRSLRILNLAYNSFDPSPIPPIIGQLKRLTHLNLSWGKFYGQIPVELSTLTRLVSLDLSYNGFYSSSKSIYSIPLKLEKPSFEGVFQNLTSVRELSLDSVNMSTMGTEWSHAISSALANLRKLTMSQCSLLGPIHPSFFQLRFLSQLDLSLNSLSFTEFDFIGNLSSLTSLTLQDCGLHGRYLDRILRLPHLVKLDIGYNNFSLVRPDFIGNFSSFNSLTYLALPDCSISGPLPSWLANFTRLEFLDLSANSFSGSIPPSYGNDLLNLKLMSLDANLLNGTIPPSLFSLPSLLVLSLWNNQLGGELSEFHNASFSPLVRIDLSNNKLQGMIPRSLFQLRNLITIHVNSNSFSNALDLSLFQNLTKLTARSFKS